VRRLRPHAVEVLLGDDLAAMQHKEPVGIGLSQHLLDRHVAAAGLESQRGQVALSPRQRSRAAIAAADSRSRDQLTDVLECPPVERRVPPVLQRDKALVRKRRRSCHQGLATRHPHTLAACVIIAASLSGFRDCNR